MRTEDWNYGNKIQPTSISENHTTISDFITFDETTTVETKTLRRVAQTK